MHFWAGISGDRPGRVLKHQMYGKSHSMQQHSQPQFETICKPVKPCTDQAGELCRHSLQTVTLTGMYVAHSHSEMEQGGIERAWRRNSDGHCADTVCRQ